MRALLILIPRQRANAGDGFFTKYTVLYIVFAVRRCEEERKGIKDTSYLHAWKRKYCTPEGGAVPYTFLVLSKQLDSRVNGILPDTYVTSLYYWAMSCKLLSYNCRWPSSWLVLSDVACSFLRTHLNLSKVVDSVTIELSRRYFQHTHFIPLVDVGK